MVLLSQSIVSKQINCNCHRVKVHSKPTLHAFKSMETFPTISVHNQVLTDQAVSLQQTSKESPDKGLHPVQI